MYKVLYTNMHNNSLLKIASFTPISLEAPNAWVGHLPFAAWLIKETAPKIFVELGTHTGNSYFTFCQSAIEAGLQTKCYAVDTWQGEEHAGFYGDEIFAKVYAHNQERYSGISRLLRMTFDDALAHFADGSVDLLHIDGLHTYEAVKHDFETWLPKLAPGAIVLFHDTNVRERDFGVWKLWEELQATYPNNLELIHSHGLGVLQLNNAPEGQELSWLRPSSPDKQVLKSYFVALGSWQLERFELSDMKKSSLALMQNISRYNLEILERDALITRLNQTILEKDRKVLQLLESTSWRWFAPVRVARRVINKYFGWK